MMMCERDDVRSHEFQNLGLGHVLAVEFELRLVVSRDDSADHIRLIVMQRNLNKSLLHTESHELLHILGTSQKLRMSSQSKTQRTYQTVLFCVCVCVCMCVSCV